MSLIVLLFLFNIMVNYIVKWFCVLRNDIFCDCFGGKNVIGIDVCVKEILYFYFYMDICIMYYVV